MVKGKVGVKKTDPRAVQIGVKISELRKAKGYSVPALAKLMKVQPDAIKRLQRGESLIQAVKLAELAQILKVTPNDFFGLSASADRELIRHAFEGAFGELLPEDEAEAMVRAVLSTIDGPSVPFADRGTTVRVRAADEVRKRARTKPLV